MIIKTRLFIISILICAILTACGSSQADLNATSTQVGVNILATQAAQVPTLPPATSTPEPTATATCTPTATLVPTATPNYTVTAIARTQQAEVATQNAEQTATAVSAQETQRVEDAMWAKLVSDGSVTFSKGTLYTVDDFQESWAQLNWYQWWSFGYDLSDFVIMTHIDWEYPKGAIDEGGCGFVIRIKDNQNHLVAFLTTHNKVELGAMTPSGYKYQAVRWSNPNLQSTSANSGGADYLLIAQKEFITVYVDGEKAAQWYVALTSSGDIGYTILSGTNKDYGTSCSFTNTRVWELVK